MSIRRGTLEASLVYSMYLRSYPRTSNAKSSTLMWRGNEAWLTAGSWAFDSFEHDVVIGAKSYPEKEKVPFCKRRSKWTQLG